MSLYSKNITQNCEKLQILYTSEDFNTVEAFDGGREK